MPKVAAMTGKNYEMARYTERTMAGEIPFKQSFMDRVDMLKGIPVSQVRDIISTIKLNEEVVSFLRQYNHRCYVVTGNLDVWIEGLIEQIGLKNNVFSSKAIVQDNYIQRLTSVVDKNAVVSQMVSEFVAVGDGNNDAEMIEMAEIGIGYGGVKPIAPSVLECATHAAYDEKVLCSLLHRLANI